MTHDFPSLGQTMMLPPPAPPGGEPPCEKLIARLLHQAIVLTEDWDALPQRVQNRILECREEPKAIEQLVKHGLLTRYQDGLGGTLYWCHPDRLAGDAIPLAARIVAVADVYDAIRCRRQYKPALPHPAAVQIVMSNSPGQFDPTVLEVFQTVAPAFEAIFRENPD